MIGPESPCTRICVLDIETGWCLGCGRSGDEVGSWVLMSNAERIALNTVLPARLAQIASREQRQDG